jgi:hypothetical protein
MKKTVTIISLLFSFSFSFTGWVIESVDTNWSYIQSTSIAIDTYDLPHIAYKAGFNLKYAYFDGSQWLISTIDPDVSPGCCSLALDSNNNPHISYNTLGSLTLKYAYYDGSIWYVSDVDTDYHVGDYNSIAVDSSNNPHISYFNYNPIKLRYAYSNGNNWQIINVDPTSLAGSYTSIKLDNNNHPYISYYASNDLKYAYYDGGNWQIYTLDSSGDVGSNTSLDLDSNNNTGISYYDISNTALKYAKYDGMSWNISTLDSIGTVGQCTSLAFDDYNHTHISYYDATNQDLKYAYNDGVNWLISTVESSGQVGLCTSLALDSSNNPHISYDQNYPMPYVLKYAHYVDDTGVSLLSFSALPQPNSAIKLVWQVAASDDTQLVGFNLYRIDLSNDPDKKYVQLNQNLITGNSPYSFLDSHIASSINYQYRLWATYTDGSREEVGTTECSNSTIQPAAFSLISVYPNPAKSLLTCRLSLSQPSEVNLALYDISGRLVLAKRYAVSTGEQDIALGLSKMAKGVYTVQVEAGGVTESKRIVIAR